MTRQIFRTFCTGKWHNRVPKDIKKVCLYNVGTNIKGFRFNQGNGWDKGVFLELSTFDECVDYLKHSDHERIVVQWRNHMYNNSRENYSIYGSCIGYFNQIYTLKLFLENSKFIKSFVTEPI